jgi:hypothetical protein
MPELDRIFIVETGEDGLVRIFNTRANVDEALDDTRSMSGRKVNRKWLLQIMGESNWMVNQLHHKFAVCRTYGEWFDIKFSDAVQAAGEFLSKKYTDENAGLKSAPYIETITLAPDKIGLKLTFSKEKPLREICEAILLDEEKFEKVRKALYE